MLPATVKVSATSVVYYLDQRYESGDVFELVPQIGDDGAPILPSNVELVANPATGETPGGAPKGKKGAAGR